MNQKWTDIKGRYIRDPRYGHRLGKSYLASSKKKKPGYQDKISEQSTDKYGFVHNGSMRDLPPTFNKSHFGIVVLGGSAAMGLGATDNSKTFSAVIEEDLRKKFKSEKISVINAGCGGYNSWDEIIYFLTEIILRKPQIVISFTGLNDFCAEYFGSKYYDSRIPNTARSLEDVAEAIKIKGYKLSFLELIRHKFKNTFLYRKLINLNRKFKGEINLNEQNFVWGLENLKKQYNPISASTFWLNQMSLLGACKAHNIAHHIYLQPCYFWNYKKKLTIHEKEGIQFDQNLFKKDYEDLVKKYLIDLIKEAEIHKHQFDNNKYIFQSLHKTFEDVEDQCYIDHAHLSNKGQEIVAKEMVRNILSSGIINF